MNCILKMHRLAAYDLPVCALKSYCTQYENPMILQVFDIHGSVVMMSWRAATGGEAISRSPESIRTFMRLT
jgi:hypothetical protein